MIKHLATRCNIALLYDLNAVARVAMFVLVPSNDHATAPVMVAMPHVMFVGSRAVYMIITIDVSVVIVMAMMRLSLEYTLHLVTNLSNGSMHTMAMTVTHGCIVTSVSVLYVHILTALCTTWGS
jgi:hypothetical protein